MVSQLNPTYYFMQLTVVLYDTLISLILLTGVIYRILAYVMLIIPIMDFMYASKLFKSSQRVVDSS